VSGFRVVEGRDYRHEGFQLAAELEARLRDAHPEAILAAFRWLARRAGRDPDDQGRELASEAVTEGVLLATKLKAFVEATYHPEEVRDMLAVACDHLELVTRADRGREMFPGGEPKLDSPN
jgi:hypothetical protein